MSARVGICKKNSSIVQSYLIARFFQVVFVILQVFLNIIIRIRFITFTYKYNKIVFIHGSTIMATFLT